MIITLDDFIPLSVNKCWQGKRFKTKDYKEYEVLLNYKLPYLETPPFEKDDRIKLTIQLELEPKKINRLDIDNILKPLIDILQKKYGFNDNKIVEINIKKYQTPNKRNKITIELEKVDI